MQEWRIFSCTKFIQIINQVVNSIPMAFAFWRLFDKPWYSFGLIEKKDTMWARLNS